ncbi:MAG: aldehyde dehydrogenase family protein, partial [Methylophaga sp.]
MLTATNPYNGQPLEPFPSLDKNEMYARIGEATEAFADWRDKSFAQRADVLKAVARQLRAEKHDIAELMALEMGKPVKEGVPEVEKAANCAEYYADHAEAYLVDEILPSDASLSYVTYQPLGTLLGILPWNAPLWLAFR